MAMLNPQEVLHQTSKAPAIRTVSTLSPQEFLHQNPKILAVVVMVLEEIGGPFGLNMPHLEYHEERRETGSYHIRFSDGRNAHGVLFKWQNNHWHAHIYWEEIALLN